MNYSLDSINESFMHKIKQVKDEKKTDILSGMANDSGRIIPFAYPELGYYLAKRFNQGHPFTVDTAPLAKIEFSELFFADFENSIEDKVPDFDNFRYTFNELKYFKKSTIVNFLSISKFPKHISEMSVPDSWTEIPDDAFENYKSLKTVHLTSNIVQLGMACFSKSSIKEIVIPESVNRIKSQAFSECENLESIIFENPDSMQEILIETLAFRSCTKLKSINLSNNIKTIAGEIFKSDISLEELDLPKGMTVFYASAIKECTGIRKLIFHSRAMIIPSASNVESGYNPNNITLYYPKKYESYYKNENYDSPFKNVVFY